MFLYLCTMQNIIYFRLNEHFYGIINIVIINLVTQVID